MAEEDLRLRPPNHIMNPLPLVSIIVPTYNQSSYLPSCLDSIVHQNHPRIQVIVADDASPDDTQEVMGRYMAGLDKGLDIVTRLSDRAIEQETIPRYPPPIPEILYLRSEQNLGASANYNRGFAAAAGDYVTFIPSDDMLLPNHVETLVAALETGYDFAYSDFLLVDDRLRTEARYVLPNYDFGSCLADWYRLGPSHLFRKELFDRHGGFSSSYILANDYDLFLRFAMSGARFVRVPRVLFYKRSHARRREGQWDPERYPRMLEESAACARRARAWLATAADSP